MHHQSMSTMDLRFILPLLVLLFLQFGLVMADGSETLDRRLIAQNHTDDLPAIRERKVLRALVVYSRTDFFFSIRGRPKGLQVELLDQYEKALNKGIKRQELKTRIKYIPTSFDHLLSDLEAGRGDVAAYLLTITPDREKRVDFATGGAMRVDELVVTHKGVSGIHKPEDMAARSVYVLKGSSYAEHLRELNARLEKQGLKPVEIKEADNHLRSEDIMELVNAGAVEITVVDAYKARLWAKVLPDIRVLDDVKLKSGTTLGWAVRKGNPKLQKNLNDFVQTVKKGTLMGNILFNRYYKRTKWIKNPLADKERAKLVEIIKLFKKYAAQYGFDYLSVAAQAYQESQLDHSRKSHVGAVGIMQVLPSTAADPNVDISDITKIENNIHAGVKYMEFMRRRYFSDTAIKEEDRLAFAWAAYNAGPAKVRRMRKLAGEMGLDPNVWFNNVEMAAGKIVGRETVQYVGNIFKYYVAYGLVRDRLEASLGSLDGPK